MTKFKTLYRKFFTIFILLVSFLINPGHVLGQMTRTWGEICNPSGDTCSTSGVPYSPAILRCRPGEDGRNRCLLDRETLGRDELLCADNTECLHRAGGGTHCKRRAINARFGKCRNTPNIQYVSTPTPTQRQPIAGGGEGPISSISGPEGFLFEDKTIGNILSSALPYVFVFAGLGLLLYLLYGGIHLMLSQGDQKAMQSARGKITGALIGFLIIFTSYWVIQILGQILGIEQITQMFGGD